MSATKEHLICPPKFQQYITDRFGVNQFGDPLFRISWSKVNPCWNIERWMPPESYGTAETYYALYRGPDGEPLYGEYPWKGRYETVQPLLLRNYDEKTKSLQVTTLPLDWNIIEMAIPLLERAREYSYWERKACEDAEKEYNDQQLTNKIADRLADALPRLGPTSYRIQLARQGKLEQKMEQIEKEWIRRGYHKRKFQPRRGLFTQSN